MVIGYAVMDWAIQKYLCSFEHGLWCGKLIACNRNEYYNSKPGRMAAEEHGAETEINMKG